MNTPHDEAPATVRAPKTYPIGLPVKPKTLEPTVYAGPLLRGKVRRCTK